MCEWMLTAQWWATHGPIIISCTLPVTLWVSPHLMTAFAHTYTHKQQVCHFILLWLLDQVSNYEGQVRRRERAADWAESGQGLFERHMKKWNGDRETDSRRRGCSGVDGEGERGKGRRGGVHGRPQIHGFDICVLLDSLLTARLSCPPSLLLLSCSLHLPHWSAVKKEKTVWEGGGHGTKQIPFPRTLCCARHAGTHLRMKGRLM